MSTVGKIVVDTEIRSAGWSKGLAKSSGELKSFVRTAESDFKSLTFQKGGAGFANAFSKLSKGAEDVATQLRMGASASKVFGDAVNQIPIVGQFKQAGEAIRELITGEKAALEMSKRLGESASELNAQYHKMAMERRTFGKFGNELAQIGVDNAHDADRSAIGRKAEELDAKIAAFEMEHAAAPLSQPLTRIGQNLGSENHKLVRARDAKDYSDAELQAYKILTDQKKLLEAEKSQADLRHVSEKGKLELSQAEEQHQFLRQEQIAADEFSATAEEKALKRSGNALQSAIVGIKAQTKLKLEEQDELIRDEHLKGLGDKGTAGTKAFERVAAAEKTKAQIMVASQATIAELEKDDAFKKSETLRDNEAELSKIKAEAGIARLRSEGKTLEAEQAQIELAYKNEIAALEKKNREEHKSEQADLNDPTLKASEDAAGLRKGFAIDEANFKNRKELIEKERAAWEQAGGPLEKYAAKMEKINEDYAKFNDAALYNAQVKKLDDETYKSFKEKDGDSTDHRTKIDLYGRRLDFQPPQQTGGVQDTAKQQLDATKKLQGVIDYWDSRVKSIWTTISPTGGVSDFMGGLF